MDLTEIFILVLKCAVLFVSGSALFDIVHYVLHAWEKSRFRLLRWLGGFHSVHHEFLDRQMTIQRKYSIPNIVLHVIPEYGTAVVGVALLGFIFGWLPAAIVIAIRTVMVIVYVAQKGEDFTHRPTKRIDGRRSLFFVGPNYHALHHVYPNQYYSSFVNIFDLIFGTNCQIIGRNFLFVGESKYISEMSKVLRARGGNIENQAKADAKSLEPKLKAADIVVYDAATGGIALQSLMDKFNQIGKDRLVPPEIWVVGSSARGSSSSDLTYRSLAGKAPVKLGLSLITRGFSNVV